MISSIHKPRCVALIPARCGSKRVPDKNVRLLAGHPTIAYTIACALESKIFESVIVSTDSQEYAQIALDYGAEVPFLRPESIAGSTSPDIEWIEFTLETLAKAGRTFDCFSILRPTSPFRQPETIARAWQAFSTNKVDSLRAVEKCSQHPGKMWVINSNRMQPLMPFTLHGVPWHSSQMAALPEVYVQNASLEIAWVRVVSETRTIAGQSILPFISQGFEGFDINDLNDWWLAEHLVASGQVSLPKIYMPLQKTIA